LVELLSTVTLIFGFPPFDADFTQTTTTATAAATAVIAQGTGANRTGRGSIRFLLLAAWRLPPLLLAGIE
jgi:hypothetical protein